MARFPFREATWIGADLVSRYIRFASAPASNRIWSFVKYCHLIQSIVIWSQYKLKKWKIYYNISPKWLPEELQPFLHQQPPVAKFCHFLPHIVIRCLQFSCFLFLPCIHHLQLFHLQDLWKDQYRHSWELLMLLPRRSDSIRNTLHNTNVK